jgi:hypothetical protein
MQCLCGRQLLIDSAQEQIEIYKKIEAHQNTEISRLQELEELNKNIHQKKDEYIAGLLKHIQSCEAIIAHLKGNGNSLVVE